MGNSYRVSFSHDPMIQKGGGLLGAFVPVRGTIYLTDDAEMVCIPASINAGTLIHICLPFCLRCCTPIERRAGDLGLALYGVLLAQARLIDGDV